MSFFRREWTTERVGKLMRKVEALGEAGHPDRAWAYAQPLVEVHRDRLEAARALSRLIRRGAFSREHRFELAEQLFDAHRDDPWVIGDLGQAAQNLQDVRYLNAAPADARVLADIGTRLRDMEGSVGGGAEELSVQYGLATVARFLGRSWDTVAERAYQRIVELSPEGWEVHYDLGLFYKTRGRFAEGQAANQRAWDLGGSEDESVRWNLGICATGAGDAEVALRVWKVLGQRIEMGRFGLPEGRYPSTKVRLAQRPLAERGADDDEPGSEESIWIERLSPCHGVVRSALYYDEIGVDYGDVVLFDGAPITEQKYGDKMVSVFPHVSTLVRSKYRIFRFAGTQRSDAQITLLSKELPADAILYSHTEQMRILCRQCWEGGGGEHSHGSTSDHKVVTGKLCAPPTVTEHDLLEALDRIVGAAPDVKLFVPELAQAAGLGERAEIERRRMSMIEAS
jgi:hypothetical protein